MPGQQISSPRDLPAAISPSGGYLAFITAADPNLLQGLALNLLKLPEGEIRTITPLSSAITEPEAGADPAMRPPEPLLAITQEMSLAWSPEGGSLAFMGAFEGPSSDLYVYSLETGGIIRLTDGPSQGIRPSWSPDGRYILHFGVSNLGTGAGYEMTGVWAASAGGTEVKTLYTPTESSAEELVGWISNDTFVVFTHPPGFGGARNLRAVNLESGAVDILWEGYFRDVDLDPQSGNLLVLIDQEAAQQNPGGQVGLYFISAGGSPLRILEDEAYQAAWSSEAGLFFARTEFGIVGITSNGDWNQLHDFTGVLPVSSPVEKELAWYGEAGLWIGNLISSIDQPQPDQVFSEPVRHVSWWLDGQGLLFFGEDRFFVLQKPDLQPVPIADGLKSLQTAWVRP